MVVTRQTKRWFFLAGTPALAAALVLSLLEPRIEASSPEVQLTEGRLQVGSRPFTGTLVERNLRNDLLALVHYRNGEKDGVSLTYHHNGRIVSEHRFRHGKKDGVQKAWYADGKLRSVSTFTMGVADGTYTEWHPNGRLYRFMRIQGGVELENKRFYESGAIYTNYVRREGRNYGIEGEPLCRAVKQEGLK